MDAHVEPDACQYVKHDDELEEVNYQELDLFSDLLLLDVEAFHEPCQSFSGLEEIDQTEALKPVEVGLLVHHQTRHSRYYVKEEQSLQVVEKHIGY